MKKYLFFRLILILFLSAKSPVEKPLLNGSINDTISLTPETIFVKGGTFSMGSSKTSAGHYSDERLHAQSLSDYYIGKYEVTVADFARFVEETDFQTEAERGGGSTIRNDEDRWETVLGMNWRFDVKGNKRPFSEYNHPVIHVTWNDANAYCTWLSEKTGEHYHLPSEAQWEYAARSRGKTVLYSWGSHTAGEKAGGNVADETGKTKMKDLFILEGYDDGFAYTSPVGSFRANALGAFDMTGNVWEWCQDYYLEDYPESPEKNHVGPESGHNRVVRGGSWFDRLRYCRVAKRNNNYPTYRAGHYGFRVAGTAF